MQYHTIDSRWEMFGCPDYDTYLEKFVIKGFFHKNVPQDIVNSYILVEYIMAHSYYHYPLYDEALSKLLRIAEMAIKLKCKQLGIALEIQKEDRRGKIKRQKRDLNLLINDIFSMEPYRNIKEEFHWVRIIRNFFMHPEHFSYGGISMTGNIKAIVVLLNKLFLPEEYIKLVEQKNKEIQQHIQQFLKPLVLEYNTMKYLLHDVKLYGSALVKNEWLYYLVCSPVVIDLKKNVEDHRIHPPFVFYIKDLVVDKIIIGAEQLDTGLPLKIYTTDHPVNLKTYEDYITEKSKINPNDLFISENITTSEIMGHLISFQYEYYWQYE